MGVSIVVGDTTLQRIFLAPYSEAAMRVTWLMPALAPAYGAWPSATSVPVSEEIVITLPPLPALTIAFAMCWMK